MAVTPLTEKERFMLDAYIINNDMISAYKYSRQKPSISVGEVLKQSAWRWFRREDVKAYVAARRQQLNGNSDNASDEEELRDRRQVIREINKLISQVNDPKLKADLLLKYSDLLNFKKKPEQEEVEKSRVQYFLPLPCSMCPLYNVWQEYYRKNKKTSDLISEGEWRELMQAANIKAKEMVDKEQNERNRRDWEEYEK